MSIERSTKNSDREEKSDGGTSRDKITYKAIK